MLEKIPVLCKPHIFCQKARMQNQATSFTTVLEVGMNHGCGKHSTRQGTLLALELLAQRPQGKVPCAVLDKVGPAQGIDRDQVSP